MHLIWTIVTRTSSDDLVMHSLRDSCRANNWSIEKEMLDCP